jgi:voltage-gated potassium channel
MALRRESPPTRGPGPGRPRSHSEPWMLGLKAFGQIAVSLAVLGAIYFLVPTERSGKGTDLPWLLLQLGLFTLVVALQVPAIIRSRHPILRATTALGVLVPLYLLIFACLYLSSSQSQPGAFTEPLDHATALYFTVTVFASVGFGDIVAQTDSMRLVVTAQMLINLIVLGAVIRLLFEAARRGFQRKVTPDDQKPGSPVVPTAPSSRLLLGDGPRLIDEQNPDGATGRSGR